MNTHAAAQPSALRVLAFIASGMFATTMGVVVLFFRWDGSRVPMAEAVLGTALIVTSGMSVTDRLRAWAMLSALVACIAMVYVVMAENSRDDLGRGLLLGMGALSATTVAVLARKRGTNAL